jgi:hypothetical protein
MTASIKNKKKLVEEIIYNQDTYNYVNFNRLDDENWEGHITINSADPNADHSIKLDNIISGGGAYKSDCTDEYYYRISKNVENIEIKLTEIAEEQDSLWKDKTADEIVEDAIRALRS